MTWECSDSCCLNAGKRLELTSISSDRYFFPDFSGNRFSVLGRGHFSLFPSSVTTGCSRRGFFDATLRKKKKQKPGLHSEAAAAGMEERNLPHKRVSNLCRTRTVNVALVHHRSIRDLPLATDSFAPTCVHKHGRVENLFLIRWFCAWLSTARVFIFFHGSGPLFWFLELPKR